MAEVVISYETGEGEISKDETIATLQEELTKYKEEANQVELVVLGSLVPFVIVFIFLVFVVYRSRRERAIRKSQFELELARSGMEMKALRSQVNPHFIFNSLASIQYFISSNNNDQAKYYLVQFSSLIRRILENSTEKMVSVKDDIDPLIKYVEMEKLRLADAFTFNLIIDDAIDQDYTFIPPLIIQPIVENAIWHGVSNHQGNPVIEVELSKTNDDGIRCAVRNPISEEIQERPTRNPDKKKSLGLSLIRERIDLLNSLYDRNDSLQMRDINLNGNAYLVKEVSLVIPCETE